MHALVLEGQVVPAGQVTDRDHDGIEHEGHGFPKILATRERKASVTTRCAVPEVERQAKSNGDAMAKSGAATMMRIRCWTMWSQNSSLS